MSDQPQKSESRAVEKKDKQITELVEALSQPPVGERGWQSMDSAPKDHFILLYCEEDRSIWLAKWQGGLWYGCDDLGLTRSGHTAGDPNVVTGWAVNGWRPLPSLPTSPGREG